LGQKQGVGPRREGRGRRGWWAARVSGPSWASGDKRAGREKGRERGWAGFLLFLNLFKSFSNFKLFSKFKHFKPFPSFQIILKSFKTSHPHS
jgi:hypothetical protein